MTTPAPYLALFRCTVEEFMVSARCRIQAGERCAVAVEQMAESGQDCAVIVDALGHVQGLLTQSDVVRRIACRVSGDTTLDQVMSRPAVLLRTATPAYRAFADLRAQQQRWAAVVDSSDRLQGVFDADIASRRALPAAVRELEAVSGPATTRGLRRCRAGQSTLARGMINEGAPSEAVQQVIASLNDDLHARAVEMAVDGMRQDGWGQPPARFALIVTGSAGRMESFLDPDQDNGFVIADYPDSEHGLMDRYFSELARRVTRTLDASGIPLCKGHVMATNPLWRKTLSQWHMQIRGWLRRRTEVGFLQSNILLDCRGVAGDRQLAGTLRDDLIKQLSASRSYIRSLTLNESTRDVGLGWFDRLITESEESAHPGELDLKRQGLMPIVEVARLYATAHGIKATATSERLDALADARAISRDDADALHYAYSFIAGLVLRRQLADLKQERPPGKHIAPSSLTSREQETLVTSLKTIQSMAKRLARDLVGADPGRSG